jgi:hypothetical protein
MSDFLSQDELDALLKSFTESLPEEDKKMIEAIATLILDPASSALGMIVGKTRSDNTNVFEGLHYQVQGEDRARRCKIE